jgi:pimeloyl-ACP methyl ester carboxylesterase
VLPLPTADGQRLWATTLPGPGSTWVVLAHGFSGSTARPSVRRVATALSSYASVLAYDARGHGRSTGRTTLGDTEVLDVDAAVALARSLGADRVVTLGWSMGGATVLRHAGLRGSAVAGHPLQHPPDAVVSVSAASRWYATETVAMRRLHRLVGTRPGRLVVRAAMKTRVDGGAWQPVPASPLEVVPLVAPLPLLLVHGTADHYLGVDHAVALHEAAVGPARLWVEEGFRHAEDGAGPELLDRLGRALPELLAGWPA